MKKQRLQNKFMEEIKEYPNVSAVCKKLDISRQTFYRWCKEDKRFKEEFENSISIGTDSINDLAESKLINKINKGEMVAIKYWLNNNHKKYVTPREKIPWSDPKNDDEITGIDIRIVGRDGKTTEM